MVGSLSNMSDELVWRFQKAVKEFRRFLFFHRPKFLSGTSTEYLMGDATHLAESVSIGTQTEDLIMADSESKGGRMNLLLKTTRDFYSSPPIAR